MLDCYCGLHRHSTYSPMDGLGSAEQIRDRLLEIGQTAMGLTDHGVSTGHPEFFRIFKEAGIKLVPGVEFYHCEDMSVRGTKSEDNQTEQRKTRTSLAHLTVLALNPAGYRNLLALHRLSYREGFYYRPRLDWPTVIRHQEGLVVMSGCVGGQISRLINDGKEDLAHQWLRYLQQKIEHFYAEIVPCPGLEISERHCQTLWKMAEELKIPCVVTDDAHFPRPQDHAAEDTMAARSIGKRVTDPDRGLSIPPYHYHCTGAEILERLRTVLPDVNEDRLLAAILRSKAIADQCEVEPPRASGPIFDVAAAFGEIGFTFTGTSNAPETLLRIWCDQGEIQRSRELPPAGSPERDVYRQRAEYEFDILRHHGFFNYFLVVADLVRWARSENILTVARGSCGGSLLCWYLGITEVDPIRYDLPVERFIGFHRKGLPDIDLDIDSRYRDRFYTFLTEKYGADNCAQIAAHSRYRARQALRDVAAAHGLPDTALAEMLDLVPEATVADEGLKDYGTLRRLYAENPRAQAVLAHHPEFQIAAELEGQVRQATVHATGFIVDAQPIHETFGVGGKPADLPVVVCDKDEVERQGGLKIDLISSDTLAVVATVAEQEGKPIDWIFRLPLDDPEVYAMLGAGRNAGVFQLQGNAAGRLMREVQPRNYDDLLAIVALARPGPLQSGGAQTFIDRRRSREQGQAGVLSHPLTEAILGSTNGVVIYQEQVMRIAREVGGLSWDEVEKIRKVISKSGGGQEMDKYLAQYLTGARAQGVSEREALQVWEQCKKAGNYLFNKGHGADYAKIAGWTAYLKLRHPAVFAAAFARFANNDDKKAQARRVFNEFRDLGGSFSLIDPNRSQTHFTNLDGQTILGGFEDLDDCGPKTAQKLVAGQPYADIDADGQPFVDWGRFYRACPKTLRDKLYATGIHEGRIDQDAVLLLAPWFVEVHYTDLERAAALRMQATTVAQANDLHQEEVRLVGRITHVQMINVVAEAKKYGQRPPAPGEPTYRAILTLADETGSVPLHVSPRRLEQLVKERDMLQGPHEGVGNSVYILARWNYTGTRMYAEDVVTFRAAKEFEPVTPPELDPTKQKKTKKGKKDGEESAVSGAGAGEEGAVSSDVITSGVSGGDDPF